MSINGSISFANRPIGKCDKCEGIINEEIYVVTAEGCFCSECFTVAVDVTP